MSKIATHPSPVRRPVPSFMLRAALDDVGGGDSFEQLWTARVGDDRFEVCRIPFFAGLAGLGEAIEVERILI